VSEWIVIPNWKRFQHYQDRNPKWIKNYTELMDDPEYLRLSFHRRGLLHCLWVDFALSRGCVPLDVKLLNRKFNAAMKMADLEALRDAGFIRFRSSKPVSIRSKNAMPEKKKIKNKTKAVTSYEENGLGFDIPRDLLRVVP
jgi:hypothetical protein